MTWQWDQSKGELTRDGKFIAKGYAGNHWGKNNPQADAAPSIGPLPRGKYRIGMPRVSQNTGPCTLNLEPDPTNEMHGRSAFRIHGDSIAHPGEASHGCIILARVIRQAMWDSGDYRLEVVE